jgi:hypothetical protein
MPQVSESKYMVQAGWDHVPHLDETTKRQLLDSTPLHLQAARSTGQPSLGSGAIYPVIENEITYNPFEIPSYWPRCFGMDVGWNRTAAIWLARDPSTLRVYAYAEHYRGRAEPIVQAKAIQARGDWIPGVIDPASRQSNQKDGSVLFEEYKNLGLQLRPAVNAREFGLEKVYQMLTTGMLLISRACQETLNELRKYHRDENGKIVKTDDHLMDSLRYGVVSGLDIATTEVRRDVMQIASAPGDPRVAY